MLARQRKHALGLEARRLMQESVNEIRLEVVGPHSFFAKGHRPDLFGQVDKALRSFAARHTNGAWSMSLSALAFPERFDTVPFASGKAVKGKCAGAILTREARQVCDAFSELAEARTAPAQITTTGRFLPGVPGRDIERILDDAPGDEIGSGKFDRPTSSAALAVNTFGFFLHRAADLPTLPALDHAGWPARSVSLERTIRFKWTGGRHPVPDCLITTGTALIGIECKRFEPFRARDSKGFSDAFWRPVWGDRMKGYQLVRDLLHADRRLYSHLDAVQLVKHALALREEVRRQKAHPGLQPILLYVYAEPEIWPGDAPPRRSRREGPPPGRDRHLRTPRRKRRGRFLRLFLPRGARHLASPSRREHPCPCPCRCPAIFALIAIGVSAGGHASMGSYGNSVRDA